MKRIDFIRHGQSQDNLRGKNYLGGRTPSTPLSELGELQAGTLGRQYSFPSTFTILSSPTARTIGTTEIAFPEQPYELNDDLIEISRGDHEGKNKSDVHTPEFLAELERLGWDHAAPGGESLSEGADRMMGMLSLPAKGDRMIAVGHSRAIRSLVGRVLQLTWQETDSGLKTPNTSITRIENHGKGWKVAFVGKMADELEGYDT